MAARTWESLDIDTRGRTWTGSGSPNMKTRCPKGCSQTPGKTDLSINLETGAYNCKNPGCGFKGSLNGPERAPSLADPQGAVVGSRAPNTPREYARLTPQEYFAKYALLPQEAIDWLHARGISDEVIKGCGLRWGPITKEGEAWIMGIHYPYVVKRDGQTYVANIKKRCLCCKSHMQLQAGCELVFYGLANAAETTVVVEGELDALACYTAGVTNVVSVPNGATLASDTARLSYLDACRLEIMERTRHVILAVDDDQPGRLLKQELARRIGFERCSYVVYPEGCKDANDVLLKHGAEAVREMVRQAKPFPSEGIARPLDMLEELKGWQADGMPNGVSTGWDCLDELYRPVLGQLTVISGIPGQGKSEFLDGLLINLWREHGWRSVIFSPENYPPSTHMIKLVEKRIGKTFDERVLRRWQRLGFPGELMTEDDLAVSVSELQDCLSFILPEVGGEGHTLDQLLEIVKHEVYRTGAKVFVLDPWNEVEHHIERGENETQYISRSLSKIRRFARHHGIAVYIVAHPTKLERKSEKFKDADGNEQTLMIEPIPTAYDISGAAHWFNKADNVIIVWRDRYAEVRGADPHLNTITVQKVKLKWAGRPGAIQLLWDPATGRYVDPGEAARSELAAVNHELDDLF